jgi:hypothetical protein
MAKLIVVMVSFGDRIGEYRLTASTEFFYKWLQR